MSAPLPSSRSNTSQTVVDGQSASPGYVLQVPLLAVEEEDDDDDDSLLLLLVMGAKAKAEMLDSCRAVRLARTSSVSCSVSVWKRLVVVVAVLLVLTWAYAGATVSGVAAI